MNAFDNMKQRLQKPPVLYMLDKIGRFQLYSDTSKYAMGSALYQIWNGKPKLIAYASKSCQKQHITIPLRNWKCVDWQ